MSVFLTRVKEVRKFQRSLSTLALHNRLDNLGKLRGESVAILDETGSCSYSKLVENSNLVAKALEDEKVQAGNVSFLCGNDATYPSIQFGIWKSGNCCVPLFKEHPSKSLQYYVDDSNSKVLITSKSFVDKVYPIVKENPDRKLLVFEDLISSSCPSSKGQTNPTSTFDSDALIIYTSGTTGSPKGVVMTHRILSAQVDNLVDAWQYSENDSLLHVLPLHHTHGIVNCLLTPLAVGGKVNMMQYFNAEKVWREILCNDNPDSSVNLFMAVPTIYAKLIDYFKANLSENQEFLGNSTETIRTICKDKIRLMVSGSAALPQPILESWEKITSHFLLERYGMTEVGMGLTNPLSVSQRRAGCVGKPFPNVKARIVKDTGEILALADSDHVESFSSNTTGDLQVQGPNVFRCYFNRPEATAKEFTNDGWFKTGDTACLDNGAFKILGRSSVDIIKCGGYKISALNVERILLSHPSVQEAAVLGVEDVTWGQKVAAVLVLKSNKEELDLNGLRDWCKSQMPSYCIPTLLKVTPNLSKNAMGKVNKKELVKEAFPIN